MNDTIKVLILALKDTMLEPVGTALQKAVADAKFIISDGGDLADLTAKLGAVNFPAVADAPERELATAIGKAFGAYMDAKAAAAKEAAAAQAKADAEAPARAATEAKKKSDAAKLFADNSRKAADEAMKKASTDAELAAARDQAAAADKAHGVALQEAMNAELAQAAVSNAAKVGKGKAAAKFGTDGVCTVAGYNEKGEYFAVGSKTPSSPPAPPVKAAPQAHA